MHGSTGEEGCDRQKGAKPGPRAKVRAGAQEHPAKRGSVTALKALGS